MKIKTFYCKKLMVTELTDYESEPVIHYRKLVDIKSKSITTLVFKYCKNCSLSPDSRECIQYRRDTNRQLRRLSKYWIDMRNHPKYNKKLTENVPDTIPIEDLRRMSDQNLYELLYYLHLKTLHVISCSTLKGETQEEIESEIEKIIDSFELAEREYNKCYNEIKKRGLKLKTSKNYELLENKLGEYVNSIGERELLKLSIIHAQTDKKKMFVDDYKD